VPPMQKLWPVSNAQLLLNHILLQHSINQDCHIDCHDAGPVSNVNKWAFTGKSELTSRWLMKALFVLQTQPEHVQYIQSP